MFDNKSLLYICTVLEAIEKIEIYSESFESGMDLREANEQMNYNAICRLLLAIGEEVRKIEEPLLLLHPEVNWKAIVGLRNRMAHDYRGIDADIVFDIITVELATLKLALIALLPYFSIPRDELNQVLLSTYFRHISYISMYLKIKD